MYLNATYQRNHDPPVSYEGQHTVDVLKNKALGFLEEAASHDEPFFLGIAPIAPHSNVLATGLELLPPDENAPVLPSPAGLVGPPIPADRHKHLFPDAVVPRTTNFNPEKPSGAHWIRKLPRLDEKSIAWHDHFYRQRLRALQSVDELVEEVVKKLDEHGILENTYIIYTTDNGYHLSQHRLRPGKECGFEEDINIPLIIRGPGVSQGLVTDVVTTHIDLAPTILQLAGAPLRADFDGITVPLSKPAIVEARKNRHEHVTVEFWGLAVSEGGLGNDYALRNNTYKAVRIISDQYNLYYSVWCKCLARLPHR
jgi:arylsulfatase A-like enzyme